MKGRKRGRSDVATDAHTHTHTREEEHSSSSASSAMTMEVEPESEAVSGENKINQDDYHGCKFLTSSEVNLLNNKEYDTRKIFAELYPVSLVSNMKSRCRNCVWLCYM
jgi:hypothetical protein